MKSFILSVVYLLIVTSSVKSVSYHYRNGRELVIPSVEEPLKDVISELKKESPVVVEEAVAEKLSENVVPESVPSVVKAVDAPVKFEHFFFFQT